MSALVFPMVQVEGLPLAVGGDGDEARVRDIDLAERMGLARPRDVRRVITANWAEVAAHGEIRICALGAQNTRGRPGLEYWLTEDQALAVVALLKTPRARDVRIVLVKAFGALRRGTANVPTRLDASQGPRIGEEPRLRAEVGELCRMVARASGTSLRRVHGYVRRIYRVPGVYHVSLYAWPFVRASLEAVGLGRLRIEPPRRAPLRLIHGGRQLALPLGDAS